MIVLPAKPIYNLKRKVVLSAKNTYGNTLKHNLKLVVQNTRIYSTKIQLDESDICGHFEGRTIPINTLGRWAFGVPGWNGALVPMSGRKKIALKIPDGIVYDYPEVQEFIRVLNERMGA